MSYWKDLLTHPLNLTAAHGYSVCAECFTDSALRNYVEAHADSSTCDFCDRTSGQEDIAASLVDVVEFMYECIREEYDDAANGVAWEGGYVGASTFPAWELFEQIGPFLTEDGGRLQVKLEECFDAITWSQRDPYGLSDREALVYSWREFCDVVQHHARFFFQHPSHSSSDSDMLAPSEMLAKLQAICEDAGLIRTLPAGTVLYRARRITDGVDPRAAFPRTLDFGPPPEHKTTMAQRMSPPGIPMLYAALQPETAVAEIEMEPGKYALANLRLLRRVHVVDFRRLPDVPSIFEEHEREDTREITRAQFSFLHSFVYAITKPITRDEHVHIDYIPTQIVTEYFRTVVKAGTQPLDGVIYPSARDRDGTNIVLFATQDNVVDSAFPAPDSYALDDPSIEGGKWVAVVGAYDVVDVPPPA